MNVYDTREEMVAAMVPKGGIGCEVGVYAGEFAEQLWRLTNPTKLILIDCWDIMGPQIFTGDQDGSNQIVLPALTLLNVVKSRFEKKNVEVIRAMSQDGIPTITDKLDWVYVDADHSYEGCLRDLLLVEPKVKEDGLIMGHDYCINMEKAKENWEEKFGIQVGKAVDEFCSTRGWKIIAKGMDGAVSFCLKKI